MTTVTSRKTLRRVEQLKEVQTSLRGLSIEPIWSDVADAIELRQIEWVIVGGESGSRRAARATSLDWIRRLRDRCNTAGVAFFVKQLGRNPFQKDKKLDLQDNHGGDWSEWPSDLRIREFPVAFRENVARGSAVKT